MCNVKIETGNLREASLHNESLTIPSNIALEYLLAEKKGTAESRQDLKMHMPSVLVSCRRLDCLIVKGTVCGGFLQT